MSFMLLLGLLALIIVILSLINERIIKLPTEIGLMTISFIVSIIILIVGAFGLDLPTVDKLVKTLGLHDIIMGGLICLLLFSGSCKIRSSHLKHDKYLILSLSLIATFIAVIVYGSLAYFVLKLIHIPISYMQACMLGAIISPTDPVSAMGILQKVGLSKRISIIIEGESLFNDGVAVALFVTFCHLANSAGSSLDCISVFFKTISISIVGAILIALIISFIGCFFMGKTKQHVTQILISIASCTLAYELSNRLSASAPIAAVIVGIYFATYIGKQTDEHRNINEYKSFYDFWDVIDKILNSSLYILIGMSILFIKGLENWYIIAIASIIIGTISRFISVIPPISFLSRDADFSKKLYKPYKKQEISALIKLLTWGGLRGGISIALAFGSRTFLPSDNTQLYSVFIISTFAVVAFSILVQGLSIGKLYKSVEHQFASLNEKQEGEK